MARVLLRYGPHYKIVQDEALLFQAGAQLVLTGTPRVHFVAAPAPGKLSRIPVVRLPDDVVADLCEMTRNGSQLFASGSLSTKDGFNDVLRLGRPMVEVTTDTYGQLSIETLAQWEAAKQTLLAEQRGKRGQAESPALYVEAHVIILWLDKDTNTLVKLNYEDVCGDEQPPPRPPNANNIGGARRNNANTNDNNNNMYDFSQPPFGSHLAAPVSTRTDLPQQVQPGGLPAVRRRYPVDPAAEPDSLPSSVVGTDDDVLSLQMGYHVVNSRNAATPVNLVHFPTNASPVARGVSAAPWPVVPASTPVHLPHRPLLSPHTPHSPAPAPASAAVAPPLPRPPSSHMLTATLTVLDSAWRYRGKVQVPISEPMVSRQELVEVVRAVAGVRRHRQLRLAYRIIASAAEGAAQGGSRGAQGALLQPLETPEDVEGLVHNILLHGYNAIRLVAAEVPGTPGGAAEGLEGTPPVRLSTPHTPSPYRQGSANRLPYYSNTPVERTPPAPNYYADSNNMNMNNNNNNNNNRSGGAPNVFRLNQMQANEESARRGMLPTLERELQPFSPSAHPSAPQDHKYNTPPNRRSGPTPAGPPSAERGAPPRPTPPATQPPPQPPSPHLSSSGGGGGGGAKKDVIVVRYEIEPTELHVSGPVSPQALYMLTSMIQALCMRHNRAHGEGAQNVLLPTFLPYLHPVTGVPSYVMPLHMYDFSEEEESEMEDCVAKAIGLLEGFQKVPEESAEGAVEVIDSSSMMGL